MGQTQISEIWGPYKVFLKGSLYEQVPRINLQQIISKFEKNIELQKYQTSTEESCSLKFWLSAFLQQV